MGTGKIIVVEGACDGIGKSTQYALLEKYLLSRGEFVVKHHFPSYDTYHGKGVENYLKGEFGKPSNVSPYFINNLYAYDRAVAWYSELKKEYDEGKTILFDRYTTSSLIYQTASIEGEENKVAFLDYVSDLEYKKIGIGEPNQVIFLWAPFDLVTKMRNARKQNDGVENDVHERDLEFMKKVYDTAVFVAKHFGWSFIDCSNGETMKSIDEIHGEIKKIVL